MHKPIIGLTTTRLQNRDGRPIFTVNQPYASSISNAGGVPVLIPLDLSNDDLDQLIERLDGILLTGGYDIDPQAYGNLPHPAVERIDNDRDRVEYHLVQASIQVGKPFLGICRGMQVVNVALGGSLYEDLPEQYPGNVQHDNHDKPRNHLAHSVKLEPESRLAKILASHQTQVNSLHHQGVRRLADLLQSAAIAPDDLIEAVEVPETRFNLAVQWHPEELQEHAAMRGLFQAFIQSCQEDDQVD